MTIPNKKKTSRLVDEVIFEVEENKVDLDFRYEAEISVQDDNLKFKKVLNGNEL